MDAESQLGRAVASFVEARRKIEEALDERETLSFLAAISDAENAIRQIAEIVGLSMEKASVQTKVEPWAATVGNLIPSRAHDVSAQLCKVSEELTKSFRALGERQDADRLKVAARDAIGLLYTDVLRPLWGVFTDLAPSEMRYLSGDERKGSG